MNAINITDVRKHGSQLIRCKTYLNIEGIESIQLVPEEAPPYTDGINTVIQMHNNNSYMCAESYDEIMAQIKVV